MFNPKNSGSAPTTKSSVVFWMHLNDLTGVQGVRSIADVWYFLLLVANASPLFPNPEEPRLFLGKEQFAFAV